MNFRSNIVAWRIIEINSRVAKRTNKNDKWFFFNIKCSFLVIFTANSEKWTGFSLLCGCFRRCVTGIHSRLAQIIKRSSLGLLRLIRGAFLRRSLTRKNNTGDLSEPAAFQSTWKINPRLGRRFFDVKGEGCWQRKGESVEKESATSLTWNNYLSSSRLRLAFDKMKLRRK